MKLIYRVLLPVLIMCYALNVQAQELSKVIEGTTGVVQHFTDSQQQKWNPYYKTPLFSFKLNNDVKNTFNSHVSSDGSHYNFNNRLTVKLIADNKFHPGWKGQLVFKNISRDTLTVSNVVPFGQSTHHMYITGKGENPLSRTYLFRPGYESVNVIVPDNAWELGFSDIPLNGKYSVCALVRRDSWTKRNTQVHRFSTVLLPGGSVTYNFYADLYKGKWQEGMRKIFQKRYLYDVKKFDNHMFERKDLKWIRHSYIIHLIMTWDQRNFYDRYTGKYQLKKFIKKGKRLYGGDDVIGIWPTWPVLGLDQRNQWDMYRNLPGSLKKQRELAEMARSYGTKYFISYNPWDNSTRAENQMKGMATLIQKMQVDGVVLDTRGSSSVALQHAADSVRSGVVMYSEGMAVPKNMQEIVAGRVHNALYYPPMLNLNKFIKPEFAIFRVAQIYLERIRREFALSFFNGYGTEINLFHPGTPSWVDQEYKFLGQTARILRENTSNFLQNGYTPLIPTLHDSIFVNKWPDNGKTVYTVYSVIPQGFLGPLFPINPEKGYHFVDLWNHQEVMPDTVDGKIYAPVDVGAFNKKWLGTNNEGAVGAIAKLPAVLHTRLIGDRLTLEAQGGDSIKIWAGRPEYEKSPVVFNTKKRTIHLLRHFGVFEGKFVVQLFKNKELLDERVVQINPGKPRLASKVVKTKLADHTPKGMVKIPAGSFTMKVTQGDQFIPYPTGGYPKKMSFHSFYMDRHPVTNAQFKKFIDATGYAPKNPKNFLKQWKNGSIPKGLEQKPVVYVSYEDARAYAKWAGKCLPTESEWQYAAQTPDGRSWPWGNSKVKVQKNRITSTLQTIKYKGLNSNSANLGNDTLDPVGSYPKGVNPYGLEDLVGSVWQMTNDLYKNGNYNFVILKGGSYYKPTSSWWYVEGGPRKLTYRQIWLRVSPGFERNATVGFRCVKNGN